MPGCDGADSVGDVSQNPAGSSGGDSSAQSGAPSAGETPAELPAASEDGTVEEGGLSVMVRVGSAAGQQELPAEFYDHEAARAIMARMPFSLEMEDYAGQEKVAGLSFALPETAAETPETIRAGELSLWSGNQLVLFYTTFSNSYPYVPIGVIADTEGLVQALGAGDVTVTFYLPEE
ncbi:MAG: hypothetical protein LIO46_06760 [Clostridiales bacterium]|nr:hypothetical protein [Clostridiales bacterium]